MISQEKKYIVQTYRGIYNLEQALNGFDEHYDIVEMFAGHNGEYVLVLKDKGVQEEDIENTDNETMGGD